MRGRWTGYKIWHVMAIGAMLVVFLGYFSPLQALAAINLDVMFFLFGMFVVGEALERSGYLGQLAAWLYGRGRKVDHIVLLTLFGIGLTSALLMNDTLAIIGTPLMLYIASKNRVDGKLLLLTLAFAITIGSAMSPIGNPQNLLIAVEGGVGNPFVTFASYLLLPTLINLFVAYVWLRMLYRKEFEKPAALRADIVIKDRHLAGLCKVSLILLVSLIAVKIILVTAGSGADIRLTYIALISAAPILLFGRNRREVLRSVDWGTLIFFAAMFILMAAVWNSGLIQSAISSVGMGILSIAAILVLSVMLSQVMSNVPLVALYLPLIVSMGASTKEMMALAAGSTIAGNLLIIGAASNIIIIQNAEKHGHQGFRFLEFAKVGAPLTLMNVLVYWIFLSI
ncbi:MAG: anion transporter [Thermoplasmata archaeon]|nr:anion transporter [Thermoplasmata archaeon]